MNYSPYTKHIPSFFRELLGQLNRVNVWAFNETSDSPIVPSTVVHYQPSKSSGINIFTSNVIKLSHELAHMVETRDDSRLIKDDYGIRKYFPSTHKGQLQAIAREARTRGIQTRMVETAFGNSTLLVHRVAYLYVQSSNYSVGKFSSKSEVNEWSARITATAYREWTKERVIDIWKRKSEYLNNWLENK